MASPTDTFLKSRVAKPTLNKWSSGFTATKKFAETNDVPLIAVWSNGDACGHCTHFEKVCMQKTFLTWQKTSKCVFWFGCSKDSKSADDKFEGTGFKWVRNGKLTAYPFVRVYWKSGKIDKYDSGDKWTGGIQGGTVAQCSTTFVKKLQNLLKNYKPDEEPAAPAPEPAKPEEPVDEGGCSDCGTSDCGGNCSCDGDCDELKTQVEKLEGVIADIKSKVAAVAADLETAASTLKSLA